MGLSRYIKIFPCPDQPDSVLLFSCRSAAVIRVSSATLAAAEAGTLDPATAETLERHGFMAPDPAAEREEMQGWFERLNARRQRFGAVVVLTRDCNLACPYCFEQQQPGRRSLDEESADLLVAMIERDYLARGWKAELEFYGGEALLRRDLIRRIADPLQQAAKANGTIFSSSMVTNGTLLSRPVAEELACLGLKSAKITLDGPPELHDRQRPFTSGKGSFAVIIANMLAAADLISLQLGGNYTRDNYREFPRLLDMLLAKGLTPDKLRMVKFDPVIGRGGVKGLPDFPDGCGSLNEPWLMEAALFLREEILRRGYHTPKPGPFACMIESDHDLVVDTDGAFYKCPAFIGRPEFAAGDLKSGLTECRRTYGLDLWKNDECLDCACLPLCFGGCRYLKLVETGTVTDVECQKEFMDATLTRMVEQDLKLRRASRIS